jgi:thioesterase domain-containing protein
VDLLALVSPPHAEKLGRADGSRPAIPPGVRIHRQTTTVRRAILGDLYAHAINSYRPGAYGGRVQLLATADDLKTGGAAMGWDAFAKQVEVQQVPGDHISIFSHHLEDLANLLRPLLA